VLLNIEDYRKLMSRADTLKPGKIETMPDALFDEFMGAVAAYEGGDDEA